MLTLQGAVEIRPAQLLPPFGTLPHQKNQTGVQRKSDYGKNCPSNAVGGGLGEWNLS
jgi:hypothetical protein